MLFINTGINQTMKPGTPPLLSVRLLDQVRERIRYLHYSLSTGKSWHSLKHSRDLGAKEVEAFLMMMRPSARYQLPPTTRCYIFNSYSRISDKV